MGRGPRCSKDGLNKGAWMAAEDKLLLDYIKNHGEGKWSNVAKETGLKRCGKSCRLRWMNYLRPDIKRGSISDDEEELIIRLHKLLGNRWSLIAGRLPGRTDNEIKNYWNSNLAKKMALAVQTSSQSKGHNVIVQKTPDQAQPQQQCSRVNTAIPPEPHAATTATVAAATPVHHRSLDGFSNNSARNNTTNDLIMKQAVNSVDSQMSSEDVSPSTTATTNTTADGGEDHLGSLPTNFMMDFNTDDHEDFCKILDCDFANLNNAINGDDDHHGSPALVLPKQMIMDKNIQAADFGSLASFLESDEDWLGNDLNVMLS